MLNTERNWYGGCSHDVGGWKITKDEQSLLSEVVEFLGMHPERVRRLSKRSEKIATEEFLLLRKSHGEMILQALDDGEIVQEEIDLLDTFEGTFWH